MDQQHIANLIYAYARHIDDGDFEAVAELFSRGSICAGGSEVRGREEALAMYQGTTRLYEDGKPRTQHVITNVAINVDGDGATADSCFTVMQAVPEALPLQAIICGRYRDEFARTGGEWHFLRRHIDSRLLGDLSQHLLIDATLLAPSDGG